MTLDERKNRIIARGEHSNHCHVLVGEVAFDDKKQMVVSENGKAVMRHLLEKDWMEGREVWTGEHKDIKLQPGIYEYVPQMVYDPLEKRIEAAKD